MGPLTHGPDTPIPHSPRPGEDDLIARFFRPLAGAAGLGLLDDVACLTPPAGHDLVLTVDALVAGVHFFEDDPADAVGWKALAVNLSDLAAKGAQPLGFLLALALPGHWTPDWLAAFARGLWECARDGACHLIGGDTVRTPGPLTISITAIGIVPSGRLVARTGARPGDVIFVSGTIGDAALALALRRQPLAAWVGDLSGQDRDHLMQRFLWPQPRPGLRRALRDHAHGSMDVSDGLVGDVRKMLAASHVGGALRLEDLPLSPAATRATQVAPALLAIAATGGDDYEIVCTVPPREVEAFRALACAAGVPVTAIGTVSAGQGLALTRNGRKVTLDQGSFSHF